MESSEKIKMLETKIDELSYILKCLESGFDAKKTLVIRKFIKRQIVYAKSIIKDEKAFMKHFYETINRYEKTKTHRTQSKKENHSAKPCHE